MLPPALEEVYGLDRHPGDASGPEATEEEQS